MTSRCILLDNLEKAHLAKASAAKPRVFAFFATTTRHEDPKTAGLPEGSDRDTGADSHEDAKDPSDLHHLGAGDALLIKGSRGMTLERIVEHLQCDHDAKPDGQIESKPTKQSRSSATT